MDPLAADNSSGSGSAVSTPSPQNNDGSGESVQSDDFVKVDNASLLLDLNSDIQAQNAHLMSDKPSPDDGLSPDVRADDTLLSEGLDNAGFVDSPVEVKQPAAHFHVDAEFSENKVSSDLLDFGEPDKQTGGDQLIDRQYALQPPHDDSGEENESGEEEYFGNPPEVLRNVPADVDDGIETIKEDVETHIDDWKKETEIQDNKVNEETPIPTSKEEHPADQVLTEVSAGACVFSPGNSMHSFFLVIIKIYIN